MRISRKNHPGYRFPEPAAGGTRNPAPLRNRLRIATSAVAAAMGAVVVMSSAASADVWVHGGGQAYESVTCNSYTHYVTIKTGNIGEALPYAPSGSGTVDVRIWLGQWKYSNGWYIDWGTSTPPWTRLPRNSTSSSSMKFPSGAAYAFYFDYRFQNAYGTFDYASEWAGGASGPGVYYNQYGQGSSYCAP